MSAAAALTPRVRSMVLCNEAIPSSIEVDVYTLVGVRHQLTVPSLPHSTLLSAYVLMSCPRRGRYRGEIVVVDDEETEIQEPTNFEVVFDSDNAIVVLAADLGEVLFSHSGRYAAQVKFEFRSSRWPQKAEYDFIVELAEE